MDVGDEGDPRLKLRRLEEVGRQFEATRKRIREFERRALAKLAFHTKDPGDNSGSPVSI